MGFFYGVYQEFPCIFYTCKQNAEGHYQFALLGGLKQCKPKIKGRNCTVMIIKETLMLR
jgi:hypothetical protein